jgi:tetratricopeptide (TPR) repeat protein
VAPIAAGEKVVALTKSSVLNFIQQNYGDAIAVEMEGRGLLQAAYANQQISALVIRGISNLIDGKSEADAADSQEIAARHASVFAFKILAKLEGDRVDTAQQIWGTTPYGENFEDLRASSNQKLVSSITSTPINLNDERHDRIEYACKLIEQGQPKQALQYLTDLKTKLWHKADSIIKYRLLANIGMAKLALDQIDEAAAAFLEARQYNSEDEKALALAAMGYVLQGGYTQAEELIQIVLQKNPANAIAHSLRVQMAPTTDSIESVLDRVPSPYRNNPDVMVALGQAALERKLYTKAEEWFQAAINKGEGNLDNVKVFLGIALMEPVTQDFPPILAGQLDELNKSKLERAVDLFTDVLPGPHPNPNDLSRFELTALVNRSGAWRLLGRCDEAIRDIEIALQRETDNPYFIKQRALLAHEKGDEAQAYNYLVMIISCHETPEASLLAASSLIELKQFVEAKKVLEQFQQTEGQEDLKREAKRLQFDLYLEQKDYENAKAIAQSLIDEEPENVFNLIHQIRLQQHLAKDDNVPPLIERAKTALLVNPSFPAQITLAELLYDLKYYRDAAEVYEQFVDKTLDTKLTRKLLYAYYYAGNYGAALELCQQLLDKYGALQYVSEMAAFLYENIDELAASRQVCEDYLKLFPDDVVMQLRLAVVNYATGNWEDLDRFLDSNPSIETLSLDTCIYLARIHKLRKRIDYFLEVIYEIRRRFYNEGQVHAFYIVSYMEARKIKSGVLGLERVENGCGVLLRDKFGDEQWYVLDDRPDAALAQHELNASQPLYQELIGKTLGDEVIQAEDGFGRDTFTIVAIQDKYFSAGQQSLLLLKKLPNVKGFRAVHIPSSEEGIDPEWLQNFDEMLRGQENDFNKLQSAYQEGHIPLGTFANCINRNPIELWEILVCRPNSYIHTWSNYNERFEDALTFLKKGGLVIVDPISLLTLHQLQLADDAVKLLGKFGIAQSTLELLQQVVEKAQGWEIEGFTTVGIVDEQRILYEFSPEQVAQQKAYFERIVSWIRSNCHILPCWRALDISQDERHKLNELIGSAFIDTVLIAGEPGRILYSDDQWLRWYAHAESGVGGVWTQVILNYCLQMKCIDEEKYRSSTLRLVLLGYDYTLVDANILVEGARQAGWGLQRTYTAVLRVLTDKKTLPNNLPFIAAEFIYKLYNEAMVPYLRDNLILKLLTAITTGRSQRQIIKQLIKLIETRFTLMPIAKNEVLQLIEVWWDSQSIIT